LRWRNSRIVGRLSRVIVATEREYDRDHRYNKGKNGNYGGPPAAFYSDQRAGLARAWTADGI
jgi:hypothetical protein